MTDEQLHEITDAELDGLLGELNDEGRVILLRKMVKDYSATAAFYAAVMSDIGARWKHLIPPDEAEWLRVRMWSGVQDLENDREARNRQIIRDAERRDRHP